jgi:hypothetical protein
MLAFSLVIVFAVGFRDKLLPGHHCHRRPVHHRQKLRSTLVVRAPLGYRVLGPPAIGIPLLVDRPILDDGLVGDPGMPGLTAPNP